MAQVSFVTPGYEEQAQQDEIARRQRMAQLLQQRAQQPLQGGMAGNVYVGPSITQGLAQLLSAYGGRKQEESAQQQQKQLAEALQQRRQDWMGQMPQNTPAKTESLGAIDPSMAQYGEYESAPAKNASSQDYLAWALKGMQIDPQTAQFGMSMADRIEGREAKQEAQKAAMTQRLLELDLRAQDARASQAERLAAQQERDKAQREFTAQQNEMNRQNQQAMARLAAALRPDTKGQLVQVAGPGGKPVFVPASQAAGMTPYTKGAEAKLPATALKMQQEELDAIGTSGAINADLGALKESVDTGKLPLGPVSNMAMKAQNFMGISSPESQSFASFQSTLEKLRNDSLRLNKGVQTEGDAQRAWNELVSNINDPKVVSQRLGEIQRINQRAMNIRQMNVDQIRSNFGVDPLDTSKYSNQQPALGQPAGLPSMSAIDEELRRRGGR